MAKYQIEEQRLDADQTAFFGRELEHIKAKSYDVRYAELKARMLIPVSSEAGPGAESITYYQYDMFGIAKIAGSYAKDLPRADVRGKKFTVPVESLVSSYGYTLQDIRAAHMANKPLEQRKGNAARRVVEQQINTIALFGNADYALPGLLTNVNIPTAAVAATGAGGTTQFANKTPDQILADLNLLANSIPTATKGAEIPTTLLLPLKQFTYIGSTPRASFSDMTILEFYLNNHPFIKEADWVNELAGTGPGGTDQMIAYRRDPDALTLEIPQEFEQLPVQEVGLEYLIPCHARIGGTIVYYPLSAAIGYGI
jgi:hypothetical protein